MGLFETIRPFRVLAAGLKGRSTFGLALAAAALLLTATPVLSKAPPKTGPHAAPKASDLDDLFARAAKSPPMLRVLLQKMPKGGDLHNHAGGSIYAEDLMTANAEAGGCYARSLQALTAGPCNTPDLVAMKGLADKDADLWSDIVDALSTRRFDQGVGDPAISGHRRFFHRRFGPGAGPPAALGVAASLEAAARDNVFYLELMSGPRAGGAVAEASVLTAWDESQMARRLAGLAPMIADAVGKAKVEMDGVGRDARARLGCGAPAARPGCDVPLRYLVSVSRETKPENVFGQMAFDFALVMADPRFVGVNIAQPEDHPVSTRDYHLQMRMFAFFHKTYPTVKMTLHAGELALGLVAPRDLKFHIKEAVEVAGASRIGHGVDIAYEDDAAELLKRMARDHIAVEINLTSNDIILGVKGAAHPLALYLAAGVPVAIATDDQGVARSDMTNEYLRAVTEQGLSYSQLKKISRDSLTYSFLEGRSLWDESGTRLSPPCTRVVEQPTGACAALLKSSAKAAEQWKLERALAAYEKQVRQMIAQMPPARAPRTN
ncbi:MAG: adenosine/AMP deaminase [Frankiales bacterium]|nr:adenosine/AMP deaminase [Frankiales bacterium]